MDDRTLLSRFLAADVPRSAWTHRAHVRVAWLLIRRDGLEGAIATLRARIRALNDANGVPNSDSDGYHETVTVAFARLIDDAARRGPACESSEAFCEAHPALLDKRALLRWYRRETLESVGARRGFVEPDLRPLP